MFFLDNNLCSNSKKMSREETQSEKIDTQKELLSFEEKHGRPVISILI